jgi:predicted nuclease with TOPRIM domain
MTGLPWVLVECDEMIDTSKLSTKAREKFGELQSQMQALVDRDRRREPKLLPHEQTEVAQLETRMRVLAPIIPQLQDTLAVKSSRLDELSDYRGTNMLIDGANLDDLVDEFIHLQAAVMFLQKAYQTAISEYGSAEGTILRIKKAARKRELQEGG